jgi:hypothetical protein
MTTRNKISEQIERLYMRSFDREDLKPKIERREIELLVDQVANTLLAIEPQQEAKVGTVDIPTCMIATYDAQPVQNSNGVYSAVLPAFPIRLPMDMGVWAIGPDTGGAFIPIRTEFWDLVGNLDEGLLEDQVGFYVEGRKVKFTKNPVVATVKMKLLVVDPSQLEKHDPYPVTPEMEVQIISKVLELIGSRGLAEEKPKG